MSGKAPNTQHPNGGDSMNEEEEVMDSSEEMEESKPINLEEFQRIMSMDFRK